jgi:hypothetical protein
MMKHYKDPNTNEIYAYEADGSQDAWIKPGLVAITDQEADEIRAQALAATIAEAPSVDPVAKLAQFLAENPDVSALINPP